VCYRVETNKTFRKEVDACQLIQESAAFASNDLSFDELSIDSKYFMTLLLLL